MAGMTEKTPTPDVSGLTVLNTDGDVIQLSTLWLSRRIVLTFLRHFGWMFARQQVAALMEVKKQLDKAKVGLVAIGSGNPAQAKEFVASFSFKGEMYVDPGLKTYKAFKLVRGLWRTLGPSSIGRGLSAMKEGFRQGKSAGDLWQQGGMFVIGPGDQMLFAHRNQAAGDHADLKAVLKACRAK